MHLEFYRTFKVLGIFLCYPTEEWLSGVDELCDIIRTEKLLNDTDISEIVKFTQELSGADLLEVQENYVDMFDRVRSLSLHLFEHVHGESRDRGQAMVDLADVYKEKGFVLGKTELPDYLPVFLEFLSSLPKDEAIEMLSDTAHILKGLGKRLAERGSSYNTIFNSLIKLAGIAPEKVEERVIIPQSFAQMDKEWEEKPIDFLGAEEPKAGGCGSGGCSSGGCGGGAKKPIENMTQGAKL